MSRAALAAWVVVYALMLLQAALANFGDYLLLDYVNFFAHEGGHFLFGWFGDTAMVLGGTLGQLLVPLLIACYFVWHRKTAAVAFTGFWLFENFLNIGTYMMDARIQTLSLTVDPEGHDWTILFASWNLLDRERQIGQFTRGIGWLGMFAVLAWFIWMAQTSRRQT